MNSQNSFVPSYLKIFGSGILRKKIQTANEIMRNCNLCPRDCKINRFEKRSVWCKTGNKAFVSSFNPHFGEEKPLVGVGGSGTIFFTHCSLLCSFCQNFDISHQGNGEEVSDAQLAEIMLFLQKRGCENINFVTPTHVVPQILGALEIAIAKGLNLPLVYNSGGYDRVNTIELLDGVFDIYLPDFKFWDAKISDLTCKTIDYRENARRAIKEMHRQVGELTLDERGVARRGLLIRHLVMPEGMAGTREIMKFIAGEVSKNTYVNVMGQFWPAGKAEEIASLSRHIRREEFLLALQIAKEEGITRLD